jgi:hypothetical protein
MIRLYLALLIILISGCLPDGSSRNSSSSAERGQLGGVCYPNNTCNDGLVCSAGICRIDGALPGDLGGECLTDSICNLDLICKNSVCVERNSASEDVYMAPDISSDTVDTYLSLDVIERDQINADALSEDPLSDDEISQFKEDFLGNCTLNCRAINTCMPDAESLSECYTGCQSYSESITSNLRMTTACWVSNQNWNECFLNAINENCNNIDIIYNALSTDTDSPVCGEALEKNRAFCTP